VVARVVLDVDARVAAESEVRDVAVEPVGVEPVADGAANGSTLDHVFVVDRGVPVLRLDDRAVDLERVRARSAGVNAVDHEGVWKQFVFPVLARIN